MKKIIYLIITLAASNMASAQTTDTAANQVYAPVAGDLAKQSSTEPALTSVEHLPEFPGGQAGLMSYLSQNLKYPAKARSQDIQGRVMIKFVVCQDGTLCNEEIVKGIGGGCDEEVVRVVKAMPRWKPGMQNGKAVRVYYTLPVTFKFAEEKQEKK